MFFNLQHDGQKWRFDSDSGWKQYDNIWAKGYAIDRSLDTVVHDYCFDRPPVIPGNFCLVQIIDNQVRIGHNKDRSFPLWVNTNSVSNYVPDGEPIWADDLIHIDWPSQLNKTKFEIHGSLQATLTMDQVCDLILERLIADAKKFLDNHDWPIRTYRSGGLDTTFLNCLLRYIGAPFKEFQDKIVEPNTWLEQNQNHLAKYWAYKQIHHWNEPCYIVTGSHGDEYFLRGPAAVAMIMAWYDVDLLKTLDNNQDCYHHWYFNKLSNRGLFVEAWNNRPQLQEQYTNWKSLADQIINIFANDHQHWHLGHTLTWTPLKDLDIARWSLCLGLDDLLDNSLNGTLMKKCIKRLDPNALSSISKYKNKPAI